MNPQNDNYDSLAQLLGTVGEAIATRPQKTSISTVSTTTPYALGDMIARRDTIGADRKKLSDALRARETMGYTIANALMALPQQQGYGTWLGDFARAFGAGFTGKTNAAIDRAQQEYDAGMKDLAQALAFDKAMGDTTRQEQAIGYTPMEYAGGERKGTTQQGSERAAKYETANENLADLYQTVVDNPITFSSAGALNQAEGARALRAAVDSRGVETLGHNEFEYLQSIMPKGFTTAINTVKEQEMMRPYTTQFAEGAGSAKKAAIKNMISSIYDAYAKEAKQQGIAMPMSREEYINSRLQRGRSYNPEYFTGASSEMYLPKRTTSESLPAKAREAAGAIDQRIADFMKGTV